MEDLYLKIKSLCEKYSFDFYDLLSVNDLINASIVE